MPINMLHKETQAKEALRRADALRTITEMSVNEVWGWCDKPRVDDSGGWWGALELYSPPPLSSKHDVLNYFYTKSTPGMSEQVFL